MSMILNHSKTAIQTSIVMIVGLSILFLYRPVWASDEQQLVEKAEVSLKNLHKGNDWFRDHGKEAKAIFIVPSLVRGAFVFGGAGGSGVLLVKQLGGSWSQPAFYTMGSASFGIQIGGDTSEIVLVVRTQRGLDAFYNHNFRLGGDLSVAIGPAGAGARGTGITGDFVSFAKSRGAYAGISVDGQTVAVADTANRNYYGKPVSITDILIKGSVSNPEASSLRRTAQTLLKGSR